MNLAADLLRIVEQAHSLARILDAAVRVIAERMHADGCSVFLLDESGDLVRGAAYGSEASDGGTGVETASVAAAVTAEGRVATVRTRTHSLVASPMLLRDSRVGALVLECAGERDFSGEEMATLATTCAHLIGIIENARIIDALDRGERPAPRSVARSSAVESARGEMILQGLGVSPGVAVGAAVFRGAHRLDLSARELPAGTPATERARVRTAIKKSHNDLQRIQAAAAREIDEEHALIFASHLLLLSDPTLLGRVDEEIARGASAPLAIDAVLGEFETRLRLVPDPYIQERIDDIDDLRSRLLDHVLDTGGRARFGARIVLTDRMPPSLVIELKTEGAQALVTESGGATSHGVLLARAMGIPVVTGIADMLRSVRPGDRLAVDGTSGVVVVRPGDDTVARYEEERRRVERVRTEYAKFRDVPARTSDGARVTLHANVGVASDLAVARDNGAEGIGLYRTEFPFIVRDAFPTIAEQVKIYRRAYEMYPDGPIQFRILDLGGDTSPSRPAVAPSRRPSRLNCSTAAHRRIRACSSPSRERDAAFSSRHTPSRLQGSAYSSSARWHAPPAAESRYRS